MNNAYSLKAANSIHHEYEARLGKAVQFYRYANSTGVVVLLAEIACVIIFLAFGVRETNKLVRMRLSYFKESWNLIRVSAFVLCFVTVLLLTIRSLWTVSVWERLINNRGSINIRNLLKGRRVGYIIISVNLTTVGIITVSLMKIKFLHYETNFR